jgi:tight adherence protein B
MSVTVLGIALAVFLMVTLGMVGTYQVVSRLIFRDAHRVRQRLAAEFGKDKDVSDQVSLYRVDQLDLELKEADQVANPDASVPRGQGKWHRLGLTLEQARVSLSVRQFLCLVFGLGLGLGLPVTWLFGLLAGLGASVAGAAVPLVVVNAKRKARQDKFLKQLPNAFDLMARVIRAGQSVPQALTSVAETFEDPIAGEFASCQQQQSLGLRPEVTFQELVQRSGILELRIFAMAMMIQRQTGGNLSEVLERLAGLIRTRIRLRQQVRAWTAEGRLQGWTLVVLPFLMFGILMVINRRYVQTLFDHVPLLVATLVFMAIGILWIRKIVNFHY